MRILFMEMDICWSTMNEHILAVVPKVISCYSFWTIDQMLSPEIRVRSAFVHRSIRFKLLFNVQFVLFKHSFDFFLILRFVNFVEIFSDLVLFFVKSVIVDFPHCENMLSKKFSQSPPISIY